jgi:hypothetical protein
MSMTKRDLMNQSLRITFLTITVLLGCKKSNVSPSIIVGNWSWNATWNDGAPGPLNPLTPLNSGTTQFLTFTSTNWVLSKNNIVVSTGTYNTSVTKNTLGENINRIQYYNTNSMADSITYYLINKDTLVFSYDLSGSVGSGATFYIKN